MVKGHLVHSRWPALRLPFCKSEFCSDRDRAIRALRAERGKKPPTACGTPVAHRAAMKMLSFWVVVSSVLALALGCVGCEHECTEIGCSDGILFDVKDAASALKGSGPVTMHLCVDAACMDVPFTPETGTLDCPPSEWEC